MGACLFSRDLGRFESLSRKPMRVVEYSGADRIKTKREQEGVRGYAVGFEGIIKFINNLVPRNEVIQEALRRSVPMYPEIAIRELVANALIHQDFFVKGAGPMVEIFSNRIEVTNPGRPLVDTRRFLDLPPQSRNEKLASLMRRVGVCEERGSGIDKVVHLTELYQLPAPIFEVVGENTRAVLFAHKSFTDMDKDDRIRACYLHACLKSVKREYLTNSSLRTRFGLPDTSSAVVSRLIRDAVDAGLISPHDPNAGNRHMKYVPFWAAKSAAFQGIPRVQ